MPRPARLPSNMTHRRSTQKRRYDSSDTGNMWVPEDSNYIQYIGTIYQQVGAYFVPNFKCFYKV